MALAWPAEALWERLQPLCPGLTVEVVAEIGSTNTALLARGRTDSTPCLLVAERQTAGRGRQGRAWLSPPGASLTASLALPLAPRSPTGWSGLSLAVGLALAEALQPALPALSSDPAAEPRLMLKWPNDLWLADDAAPGGGRKLGGILIETAALPAEVSVSAEARWTVIGFGLNVQPDEALAQAAALSSGYATVQAFWPQADAPAVLARVAEPLLRAVLRFEAEGLAPSLAGYAARDLLVGRPVQLEGANPGEAAVQGIAEGLATDGALRVRHAAGVARVQAGEVRVRPAA